MKFRTAAAIEFTTDSLSDELASILLPPVDISHELIRQGDGYAFKARHVSYSEYDHIREDGPLATIHSQSSSSAAFSPSSTSLRDAAERLPTRFVSLARSTVVT
jgi:hypothetical protein